LLQADRGLVVRMGTSPAHLPEAGAYHMAGLPGDVAISLHLAAPIDTIYPGVQAFSRKFVALIRGVRSTVSTPEEQAAITDAVRSTDALLLGGKAESIGAAPDGHHHGIIYFVEQGAGPMEARFTDWAGKFNTFSEKLDAGDPAIPKATIEHLTTAGGLSETRISLREGQMIDLVIDGVEKDGKTYLTVAAKPGNYLDKLASLPQAGPMPALISGKVNLDQARKSVDPAQNLPWPAALAGQEITFSLDAKKDGAECEVQLPEDLLKQVTGIFAPHQRDQGDTGTPPGQPPKDGGL
ncbi:MAG TPA: hypothetical protein VHY37_05375, partial [Tepidisphaeraceae bacterium]|nr:hypothetical protein [Tepidisphaeraceae bacterium]